ncbi:MAG: hypothetical protein A2958_02000 [Candidatus Levybacteria bacterium RIFCSPLOWO2_01_FULL_38_13]|nr:MAG: hypothetical protein A2629_02755 [Candidatus Levybacteria bacterium RIFCSPHIGHO2_01_FULL_41_15]OGH35725.1 MAG: hypothetical protein A2958_02000 [Candidatus Levybacteria bacterium RIFCSPLOWO2_01_FULL_38_13]
MSFLERRSTRRNLIFNGAKLGGGLLTAVFLGCGNDSNTNGVNTPIETEIQTSRWTNFRSDDYPYQISYPSDWQALHISTIEKNADNYDEFIGSGQVLIRVTPIDFGMTLEQYKNQVVDKIEKTIKKSDDPSAKVYESQGAEVDGVPAWTFRHKFDFDGTKNEKFYYVFIKGGEAWSITFSAPQTDFQDLLPVFQKMVDSFRFTD